MTNKNSKPKLRLVSNKIFRKTYHTVTAYLCDGSAHVFNLNEWDVYRDDEWVEFHKLDNTDMEIYYSSNIIRISFIGNKTKLVGTEVGVPVLKPVA